jgi:DNA-repair protein complementing XP-A cells
LKAKALREQHDKEALRSNSPLNRTPSGFSAGQKRPHSALTTPSSSHPPQTQRDGSSHAKATSGFTQPLDHGIRPAKKFDKYIEYDFSQMSDTKGGFLSSTDDPHNRAMRVAAQDGEHGGAEQRPPHMTMKEWERHQLLKKLRASRAGQFEPSISALRAEEAKRCAECGSLELNWTFDEIFGYQVCAACEKKLPEKYSLLTKTEARDDYLLTNRTFCERMLCTSELSRVEERTDKCSCS